jgi:hypothetical protein
MFELKEDCDIVWMGVVLDDGETDSMKGGHREGFYTRGEIVLDRDQHDLRRIGSVFGQFSETDLLSSSRRQRTTAALPLRHAYP